MKPQAANFRLLLSSAWRELGTGEAISSFEARHKCEFPVERPVFAMVLNRLVDPESKLACNEWVKDQGFVREVKSW